MKRELDFEKSKAKMLITEKKDSVQNLQVDDTEEDQTTGPILSFDAFACAGQQPEVQNEDM